MPGSTVTCPRSFPSLRGLSLLVVVLFVGVKSGRGQDMVSIGAGFEAPVPLADHVFLLEDSANMLHFTHLLPGIATGRGAAELAHAGSVLPNPATFWMRFTVHNTSDVPVGCWLRYEPVWDSVVTYIPRNGGYSMGITTNTGTMRGDPFGYPMRTYLELGPNAVQVVIVHVFSAHSILDTPLHNFALYPVSSESRQDLLERIFQSFWFGFMMLMVVYLVGSYIAFRERSFLHITCFIVVITAYFSLIKGTIYLALPAKWTLQAVGILSVGSLFTGIGMMASITDMRRTMPGAYRWMGRVMLGYAVLGIGIMFLAPSPVMIMVFNVAMAVPLLMILRGVVHALFVVRSSGRLQAVALLIGTLGALVHMLMLVGAVSPGFVVGNAFQATIGIMLLLFAISISRRAWLLRLEEAHQREAALRNALDRMRAEADLLVERESRAAVEREKRRSDELLHNILPMEVAAELKARGRVEARHFDVATILFSDFVDFTGMSAQLSASALVDELNICFQAFDEIIGRYGLEKIKTIGDAYMAAGGLPDPALGAPADVVLAGLTMQSFIQSRYAQRSAAALPAFRMRVGIHTGPVVAGVVGVKKFQYDIWGDTVNIASRMESSGEAGKVNISEATYDLVKGEPGLLFTPRGKVMAKGKGEMEMWFVERR